MKKLLLVTLLLNIASLINAQDCCYCDTTYDRAWWDTLNSKYNVLLENSNRVIGLKKIAEDSIVPNWRSDSSSIVSYAYSVGGDSVTITQTQLQKKKHRDAVEFQSVKWRGSSEVKFGENADTLFGMFVDMDYDIIMTADIMVSDTADVCIDLVDVNGHVSTSNTQCYERIPPGKKIKAVFDFDEKIYDWYNGYFWGVSNGRSAPSELSVSDFLFDYDSLEFIPFDGSKVVKLRILINPNTPDTVGSKRSVTMSNIVLGDPDEAVPMRNAENLIFNKRNVAKAYFFLVHDDEFPPFYNEIKTVDSPHAGVSEQDGIYLLNGTSIFMGNPKAEIHHLLHGTYLIIDGNEHYIFSK